MSQYKKCDECKRDIFLSYRYCCNPNEKFCINCSLNTCKKCHKTRNYAGIDKTYDRGLQERQKIIKCHHCFQPQKLSSTEYFHQSKCQVHFCHSCIVKFYNHFNSVIKMMDVKQGKVDLPVQLPCGCELSKERILLYLQKYCYHCSEKLFGGTILLKNQCKIMKSCYNSIKRQAGFYFTKLETKQMLRFVEENLIKCTNCENTIDGQARVIGDEIDGLYVCSICLSLAKITESTYQSHYRPSQQAKRTSSSSSSEASAALNQKSKKEEPKPKKEAKIQEKGQEVRAPIELGKKKKPHLVNGSKYYQFKCQICHANISKLINHKQICEQCQKSFSEKAEPQQKIKSKKEELFQTQKNLLIKQIDKQRQSIKQSNVQKNEQKSQQSNQQRIEQKSSQKMKSSLTLEEKEEAKPLIEIVSDQSIKEVNETQQILSNQMKKEQRPTEEKSQLNNLKQLSLNSRQSSINEQFFPPQVQALTIIDFDKAAKETKCFKCNYVLEETFYFKLFEKQAGKEATLRIAEDQEELAKQMKQNKLQVYCNACYFSIKMKAKSIQESKEAEKASSRYKSAPKKYKKDVDTFQSTFTSIKNASNRQMCNKCFEWVKQNGFNLKTRTCNVCTEENQRKQGGKQLCSYCSKEIDSTSTLVSAKPMCQTCRILICRSYV